ncbi:type II toxin-antitoxin system VapB family antitoxin [Microbacterium aurum]
MSLNIKNEDVHAAVRDLAERLGVSQTSASSRRSARGWLNWMRE